ncbi:MAG: phosphoenolpyruvate synthase, partial [Akkermansiaceae bacterium]|nr:phosphoenolpyruvate synthase [Armatimonadota bacterium]
MKTDYVLWQDDPLDSATRTAWMGGKAAALARLQDAELPIPAWCVLTPSAFDDSLTPAVCDALARMMGTDAESSDDALRLILATFDPSETVRTTLNDALTRLCPNGEPVAVRSSAVDEDGSGHSFAGQLDSFLWVAPADVPARVADVWRSGFSDRIQAYRRERNLPPVPRPPAVLIQRMVNADAAGVAFSADPVTGRRSVAVVAAVYGLGTALVSGDVDADTWKVGNDGAVLERAIATKTLRHVAAPGSGEGVQAETIPDALADVPVLTDAEAAVAAAIARKAQAWAGRPQDIEWARENGNLYLLQSRPITTLATLVDPEGVLNVWDNSNIAESYNGVTTPLTFTFARNAYEHVYRAFCRLLTVPAHRIAGEDLVFRNLLGLIRGRVYYNLPNWYRLLALLPGYAVNRTFMEQMMGVKEGLPEEIVGKPVAPTAAARRRDMLDLSRSVVSLFRQHRGLPKQIDDFYRRLNTALAPSVEDLARMRPDELAAHYHDLEKQLLTRWDAPLVNDFFAMIFHGLLRRLSEKWLPAELASVHNDLVSGEGGIISAEPAQRVQKMAEMVNASVHKDEMIPALRDLPASAARRVVKQLAPQLDAALNDYLAKFGDRCLEELKLESATLHDDPLPLLRAVANTAAQPPRPPRPTGLDTDPRLRAERAVDAVLRTKPLQRAVYSRILANARRHVRDRENLRFERTRVFGRVRRIFLELGRRFHALDLLDDPRDVFHLEVQEILGFVEGTATATNLRGLADLRKADFDRFRALPTPADRCETRGTVSVGNDFTGKSAADDAVGEDG